MTYIDSHCHLNCPELRDQIPEELARCRDQNVGGMVVVGTTLEDSREALAICRRYSGSPTLVAAAGIHPHEAKDAPTDWQDQLNWLLDQPEVRALGEIGLDYHYDLSPRDVQRQLLTEQLQLAARRNASVIFHLREASDDFWSIIDRGPAPRRAVLHCFTGTADDAARALERGWYIGVTGVVTFKRADELRAVLEGVPLKSLLVETDCPYMAPVPNRGKTNRPSWVPLVYQRLALLKGTTAEQLAVSAAENVQRLFGLEAA